MLTFSVTTYNSGGTSSSNANRDANGTIAIGRGSTGTASLTSFNAVRSLRGTTGRRNTLGIVTLPRS